MTHPAIAIDIVKVDGRNGQSTLVTKLTVAMASQLLSCVP